MDLTNKNFLGAGLSLISAVAAALALTLFVLSNWSTPQEDQELSAELASTVLNLERELGYGGLIHNFKNYLLRPEETTYRDAARNNVEQLQIWLHRLSVLMVKLDLDAGLMATQQVVQQYGVAIDRVESLHLTDMTPQEIDRLVRIDDRDAFADIENVAIIARDVLAQRVVEQMRKNNVNFLAVSLLLAAFAISIASAFIALIADKKRRERELIAAHNYADDLEDMARIATHDIRSPLKQIAFLVDEVLQDNLQNHGQLTDDSHEDLRLIKQRSLRVDAMVEETLGLMRTSTAAGQEEFVDLRKLVNSIVELEAPPGLPVLIEGGHEIRVDKAKLTIVLRNLISNAIKHGTNDNPCLKIRFHQDGKFDKISIEDNGPGIAKEHRERIFSLFATLSGACDGQKVEGVGLAMVRKIVRRLGGDVSVDGSALGGQPLMSFCQGDDPTGFFNS